MKGLIRALRRATRLPGAKEDEFTVTFNVEITEDALDGGYMVRCIDLPGCVSQGETEEEAISNIVDAIGGVLTARMRANVRDNLEIIGSTAISSHNLTPLTKHK